MGRRQSVKAIESLQKKLCCPGCEAHQGEGHQPLVPSPKTLGRVGSEPFSPDSVTDQDLSNVRGIWMISIFPQVAL